MEVPSSWDALRKQVSILPLILGLFCLLDSIWLTYLIFLDLIVFLALFFIVGDRESCRLENGEYEPFSLCVSRRIKKDRRFYF